jgi:cobalt-zinc-cadmium resistance protein CzcA
LLSVGAIDFGLIVDATVIMVENIFRHLSEGEQHYEYAPSDIAARAGLTGKLRTILRSASEVNQAIFFAAGIIIAGFVPLFTLSGVEGHIFARWQRLMPMPSPEALSPPSRSRRL